ncbi:hypothetical protein, partial [Endozoicomonas atrinae]|uniref:hypothetical protein n=1 Tax=Endozoicomonas atrinae TaxID=1333660 RepID=UPI001112FC37
MVMLQIETESSLLTLLGVSEVLEIFSFVHQPSCNVIPIAFSKSLSCRQLCLGIITMHYLEQMSRRPQLPEGFNDVDF